MKAIQQLALAGVLVLGCTQLLAHASLTAATPGDGAIVNEAPQRLELEFSEDTQLLRFTLNRQGMGIPTGFAADAAARRSFALPLPALGEGEYEAAWTLLGADGHRVEGSLRFTVDASAEPNGGQAAPTDHAGHAH